MPLDLDPEQSSAVNATERVIAVLAGPGSGKTRTLCARASHLLTNDSGSGMALLLTFMNKAAAEMASRVIEHSAVTLDRVDASTFHAFGLRFLKSHGSLAGLPEDAHLIDEEEAQEIFQAVGGTSAQYWELSRLRCNNEEPTGSLIAIADDYRAEKLERSALDFNDLIVITAEILRDHAEVAQTYGTRYRHLLVDEFQDTNAAQFQIITALAEYVETISVFADDDQAIMRFAGASSAHVKKFIAQLDAKEYPLTVNYRCADRIVNAANSLLDAEPSASNRRMRANRPGGTVEVCRLTDPASEAEFIADAVADALPGSQAGDFAVLARNGYRLDAVKAALDARQIPVSDWRANGLGTDARRTLRALLSFLRSFVSASNEAAVSELAGVAMSSVRESTAFVESHAGNPVAECISNLRTAAFEGCKASELIVVARDGLAASAPDIANDLGQLVGLVASYESHDPSYSVEDLLAELALGSSGGRSPGKSGGVKLATLHSTKGLEWPTVFLAGADEGMLPFYKAHSAEDIADERRLCFVGVCRAEQRLVITGVHREKSYGKKPSRFIAEMGL
jgi:superfamily I DNA/RNA helicase